MNTSIRIRENELSQIAVFFLDIFNLFKQLVDFDRQWEDPRLSVFRRRDVKSVCQCKCRGCTAEIDGSQRKSIIEGEDEYNACIAALKTWNTRHADKEA